LKEAAMALIYPLSFQLYSGRKFPPLNSQLTIIADAGFTNVEPYGALYGDASGLARLLGDCGLTAKTGHFGLSQLEEDFDGMIAAADILGITTLIAPSLPDEQRPADVEGWKAVGARLAVLSEKIARAGRRFAWHNHAFEFAALPDGSRPIEHILGDGVLWEADIAWLMRAGAEAAPWLKRYEGRVPAIHVKDIAFAGENSEEDGWADVGTGTADWQMLWPLCVTAGAEIMVAEHDNPSDLRRFATVSADTMRTLANN
jgi:sugar phosphate isomerase/epimerase